MPVQEFRQIIIDRLGPYLERVSERRRPCHMAGDLMFIHAGVVPDKGFQPCLELRPQDHVAHRDHWAWTAGLFQQWTGGWEVPERIIVHGHVICTPDRQVTVDELVECMDSSIVYRRICLDIGGYEYNRLGALEAHEGRYRFHIASGE